MSRFQVLYGLHSAHGLEDTGPSSRKGGFDSRTSYCEAERSEAWYRARVPGTPAVGSRVGVQEIGGSIPPVLT
jgi:hypothetical protein